MESKATNILDHSFPPFARLNHERMCDLQARKIGPIRCLPVARSLSAATDLAKSLAPELVKPPRGPFAGDSIEVKTYKDLGRKPKEKIASAEPGLYKLVLNLMSFHRTVFVDGKQCFSGAVPKGRIYMSAPEASVRVIARGPMATAHLFFSENLVSQTYDEMDLRHTSAGCELLSGPGRAPDPTLEGLVWMLAQEKSKEGSINQLFTDTIGLALLTHLIRRHSNKSQEHNSRPVTNGSTTGVKRALDYIEHHLVYPLALADLAKSAGMSVMHFAAQFRKATGVSPHQYVLQQRIERSKRLLAVSRVSIRDVAAEVGFETSSHFCVVFKRLVGESPARWRNMI